MTDSSVPEFGDTRAALHASVEAKATAAPEAPTAPAIDPATIVLPEGTPLIPAPAPVPASGATEVPAAAPAPQPELFVPAQPQPAVAAPAADPVVAELLAKVQALEARIAAPAPSPQPVAQPAPEPAPAPPSVQEVHAYAQQQAQFAPEIPETVAEYRQVLGEIGRDDGRGGWVPGTLGVVLDRGGYAVPDLDSTIRTLKIQLDPEQARAHRLPPIDELSRSDYQQSLKDLEQERRDKIDTFRNQRERASFLADRYQRVYDYHRGVAVQGYNQYVERQQQNAAVDSLAVEIRSAWIGEFNRVLTDLKVNPANKELAQRLWNQVELHGQLASNEQVAPERLNAWMKGVVQPELGWVDTSHRLLSGVYGAGKLQDAGAAISAPRAPGANGAPATGTPSTLSYEEQVQANKMRLRGSWGQRRRA